MRIGHRSATTDEKIVTKKGKKIMTLKAANSTSDSSRFLIITLPTSYDSNFLYFLSIHETGFVNMLGRKKKKNCSHSIAEDVWGQILRAQ